MTHTASDPSERVDDDFRAELAHTALARPGGGVFAFAADSVEGLRQRVIGYILVVSSASIGGFEQCTDPTLFVSSSACNRNEHSFDETFRTRASPPIDNCNSLHQGDVNDRRSVRFFD